MALALRLGPTLFLLYINDLPDNVICSIGIYTDDTTLNSQCDQESDLQQQLELTSALESHQKQKGPGTIDQSLFRLGNQFRKIHLLVTYYPTKFDDVI